MADYEDPNAVSELGKAFQDEVDGTAKQMIRQASVYGPGAAVEAAKAALDVGATPAVIRQELEKPLENLPALRDVIAPVLPPPASVAVHAALERAPSDEADTTDGGAILNLAEARKRKLEREESSEAEKYLNRLRRAQHMLAAIVKKAGRIRISRRELEEVSDRARFGVKVQQNGDVVVDWLEPR